MKKGHYLVIVLVAVLLFGTYFYLLKSGQDEGVEKENETFPQLTTEVLPGERLVELETSMGIIKIKLFPEQAPKTVENFITHSENGYYDGLTFHRILNDFMIQGGDPLGTGAGGESIYGEFFEDEISPQLYNLRGALSMANMGVKNTNSSQFFIVQRKHVDENQVKDLEKANYPQKIIEAYKANGGTPWLDQAHTVFGQVIEGMDVVDKIASVPADSQGKPNEDVLIKKVSVLQ